MNTDISAFEENKFYVMTGKGTRWSDFDGPFDSVKEGIAFMRGMLGDYAVPEVINGMVLTRFEKGNLEIAKLPGGVAITGQRLYWEKSL